MATIKNFTEEQENICKDLISEIIANPNHLVSDCIYNLFLNYRNEGKQISDKGYLITVKCFLEKLHIENYEAILDIQL